MLLKSLVVSIAAAVLAPTIALVIFIVAHSDDSAQPKLISATPRLNAEQATDFGQTKISGRFVLQEPWRASAVTAVHEPKTEPAAARSFTTMAAWLTTVSCPGGQPLPEEGHCPSRKIVNAPIANQNSVADVTPVAGSLASGETEIDMRSHPLPGRMSVGGPKSYQ